MIVRPMSVLFALLAVSACGEQMPPPQSPTWTAPVPLPVPMRQGAGLDKVIGKDARALVQMFGPAAQDVREEGARKLQFASGDCILDAYLYPSAKGKEPVVTYLSARVADGRDADEASCVAALSQRR